MGEVCIRVPGGTSFCDGTQVGLNEARGNEDNVFGRSCIHSSRMGVQVHEKMRSNERRHISKVSSMVLKIES